MNSGLFYGIFTVIWLCYSLMWVVNTWLLNKPHSKPLHRVITFFLIFKCIYLICSCLSMYSCKANKACYWDMATTSTYTIYNTFLLTNLLLISKGFNIIREYLDRSELTFMAIMMGGIYLSFSAYTINKSKLILILLIVLCILTYFYLNFTNLNIKKLENRLEELLRNNIQILIPAVLCKLRMYKVFYKVISFYLSEKILYLFTLAMFRNFIEVSAMYSNLVYLIDEGIELVCIGIIMFFFRAMFRGALFDVNSPDFERELREIVGLVQAKVPISAQCPVKPYLPVLLITPRGKSNLNYGNFLVANPVKYTFN